MPPSTKRARYNSAVQQPTLASVSGKSAFWDRIAHKYSLDAVADPAGYETTLHRVQRLLCAEHEVLEIGCGTGTTAIRLAPFTRRLLATDVSGNMIAIARQRLEVEPTPQLTFALAEADASAVPLAFGQSAYDAVLAFNVLHVLNDLDKALALAFRALKPGGLLISKTPCLAEMNPLVPWLALPLMRALGKAPHVLCFKAKYVKEAISRQGMIIESVERHGSRGRDIRVFIVARKPA